MVAVMLELKQLILGARAVLAIREEQQMISYAKATTTLGLSKSCPEVKDRLNNNKSLNFRQKQRGISYARAAMDIITQWFKYAYGTPEKMMAAWPRLKLYNFNTSIL